MDLARPGLVMCAASLVLTASPVLADARVVGIDVDLTLDPQTGVMTEQARVKVQGSGLTQLSFRIHEGLSVERSSTSRGRVEHLKTGEKLRVEFEPPIDGDRTFTFLVTGRPKREGERLIRENLTVLGPDDLWYPVFGDTLAEAEVTIRVPEGWAAVGPGRAVARSGGAYTWRPSAPVRTIAIAAAPGLTVNEATAVRQTVRVATTEAGPSAKAAADALSDCLAWFAGTLAPYPFDGFNVAFVPGFDGRERGSGIMIVPLDTPVENSADAADLLAGQWFGERVAGDGPWIDAFAAWYATVYARDRHIPLPQEVQRLRDAYFSLYRAADVPISKARKNTPAEVVRGKGSAAPDMVRLVMGDRRFFRAIRSLFEEPIGSPMSLEDMRNAFEKSAGQVLLRSFSDWFDRTGAPKFEAELRTFPASGGGWRVDLSLTQLRGNYELPVEVVFRGPGQEHREVIKVDEERTTPFYVLPFRPEQVEIDPGRRLFRWETTVRPPAEGRS